ncbi:MAG: tagaturonate epimerase family protein [Bacillota bacterium]
MISVSSLMALRKSQKTIAGLKAAINRKPEFNAIYPESLHEFQDSLVFLIKTEQSKELIATGPGSPFFQELMGDTRSENGVTFKCCPLTVANSRVVRQYFPFTNPVSLASHDITIGLGDRLGLASPGHLQLLKGLNIRPVLAQQSIRELNLTGRNYQQVLADAVWAVFQEDYQAGFGADGDHLKTFDDIKMALDCGFTMITLDCSEHIHNLRDGEEADLERLYTSFGPDQRRPLETAFLGKEFNVSGMTIAFPLESLRRNAVIYQKAVDFAIKVYRELVKPAGNIDFEVSIDETLTPTEPAAHFFVAKQLVEAGVKINSLAPRFCGEFQKGIDYIGDIRQFEREYKEHELIAKHFGYKLSIHSGSDKFSVFPVIGRESKRFHLKTAGTNWLEAIRVIIEKEPDLYRQIHLFALEHLDEAKKYYHISAEPGRIPDINSLSAEGLKDLMNQNDARQLIHITYGLILQAKDEKGTYLFRDKMFACWHRNEDLYAQFLRKHIGRHLGALGLM